MEILGKICYQAVLSWIFERAVKVLSLNFKKEASALAVHGVAVEDR